MKYEGHSCLWHYILIPFAKTGLPFDAIKILGILPAIITAILILKKAPFNRFTKVLILFSSIFLYYLPAIVRPYSLMPLLITLLCIIYKDRNKKPILYGLLLAFLSNMHITIIGFTGILTLMFFIEEIIINWKKSSREQKRKAFIGIIISGFGILFIASLAVWGSLNSIAKVPAQLNFSIIFRNLKNCWKDVVGYILGSNFIMYKDTLALVILGVIIIQSILTSRKQGIIFAISVLWFWFVISAIWPYILNQRACMLFLFLFFYAWCYRYDRNCCKFKIVSNATTFLLCFICIISLKNTVFVIADEINRPYANSKQMANYIETNIENGSFIVSATPTNTSPVIAYLDGKNYVFYDIYNHKNISFVTWDSYPSLQIDEIKLSENLESKKAYLLFGVFSYQHNLLPEHLFSEKYVFDLIYKSEQSIYRNYFLYEFKEKT